MAGGAPGACCRPTSPSSSTSANLARLAANRARAETPGAVRAGSALLAGLVRCGRCGRRMTVRYHAPRADDPARATSAPGSTTDYGAGQRCQHLAGACVDALRHRAGPGRAWRRPPWRCRCAPPSRSEPSGPSWTGCGAQRLERAALRRRPGAALLPAGRTGEPPGRAPAGERLGGRAGRPAAAAARTTTASPAAARQPSPPPSGRPSPPWPPTSPACGPRRPPPTPTARRSSAPWSSRSPSPCAGTSERVDVTITWAGGHTTGGRDSSARSPAWSSSAPTRSCASGSASWPSRATAPRPSPTGCTPRASARPRAASASGSAPSASSCTASAVPGRSPATAARRPARSPAPTSGGWTTWPPSSPCRPSPCTTWIRRGWVTARQESSPSLPVDHPRRPPRTRRAPPTPNPSTGLVHPPTLGRRTTTSPQREPRSPSQSTYMSAPWLTHLDRPAASGHPDQLDQGGAGRAEAGVEGQLAVLTAAGGPAARNRRPGQPGRISATLAQSYTRGPLAPSPALSRRHAGG